MSVEQGRCYSHMSTHTHFLNVKSFYKLHWLLRSHLHLLQSLQFSHQILDLSIFLWQHGLQSLQLSRVSPGALQLHQSGYLHLHQTRTSILSANHQPVTKRRPTRWAIARYLQALHLLFAKGVYFLQRLILDLHTDELPLHLSPLILQLQHNMETFTEVSGSIQDRVVRSTTLDLQRDLLSKESVTHLSKQWVPFTVWILGLLKNLIQLDLQIPVGLTRFLSLQREKDKDWSDHSFAVEMLTVWN